MRQTTLTYLLLNVLEGAGEAAFGVLVASFFPKQYPFTALGRQMFGLDPPKSQPTRRTLSATLARLRHEGLVARRTAISGTVWRLSRKGRERLDALRMAHEPLPPTDGRVRILSFDIPERDRRQRTWLREALRLCDYQPVQKSVWVGKRPLPVWIFEGARKRHIGDCLHLFEVSRSGTLRTLHHKNILDVD